ncbi:MAG: GYF domain-containing protein [Verrucomicrobiota bacterium]
MEPTYKVRGSDLKEYGPVELAELTTWLREGRLAPHSEVMRNDMNHWAAAENFSELKSALPGAGSLISVAVPAASGIAVNPVAVAQLKSGASWFYWIAALSLINSAVAFSGSDYGFLLGLGVTKIIDAFGRGFETSGKVIALVLDLIFVALFALFGVFANKAKTWAFIVGMVLYGLDSLFSLLVRDWFSFAFHGFALFCLSRGFKACRELNAR